MSDFTILPVKPQELEKIGLRLPICMVGTRIKRHVAAVLDPRRAGPDRVETDGCRVGPASCWKRMVRAEPDRVQPARMPGWTRLFGG